MVYKLLRASKVITNCLINTNIRNNATSTGLLVPQILQTQLTRNVSFYLTRTGNELWKSVTSVSNAGRKRGRAKNLPKKKNLNKGQILGIGKIPVILPGLNAPLISRNNFNRVQFATEDKDKVQLEGFKPKHESPPSTSQPMPKKFKIPAEQRGWTGGHLGGRKLGPPDPVNDEKFKDFESWILLVKMTAKMTPNMNRVKYARSMVITGNGNGLAGFSLTKGKNFKTAVQLAKNRAGQRLIYFNRYNNHTVYHDFFTQFGSTKLFVEQKPEGYGLVCHRVVKICCQAIGIKDLYAKVEGSIHTPSIVKAFFIGLLQQKTHEKMANEKQLHLVEMRRENHYFPTVLASPPVVRTASEIPSNEDLNFNLYVMNGKVSHKRKRPPPFYTKLPSYKTFLRKEERRRGQFDTRIYLKSQYDGLYSFLSEKYPEAGPTKYKNTPTEDAIQE